MKTFFLGTNVLLQCHPLKDLPWQQVSGGQDVLLIISRPVQDEIDELKHSNNTRRARRARTATSLIRDLILVEPSMMVLRKSNPCVRVCLAPVVKLEKLPYQWLDLTRNDDRLIAEAVHYRDSHPNENVAILTHDTQPLQTAKYAGLSSEVGTDDWLLAPELDERDKRIAELERRLQNLERSGLQIELSANNDGENDVRLIEMLVQQYARLPEERVDELVLLVAKSHPLVTVFDTQKLRWEKQTASDTLAMALGLTYKAPSTEEIEVYQKDYAKWLKGVKEFFEMLPSVVELPSRYRPVSVSVSNIGSAPAENLLIEFETRGGILLADSEEDHLDVSALKLPSPPEPPQGRLVRQKFRLDFTSADAIRPRAILPEIPRFDSRLMRDKYA